MRWRSPRCSCCDAGPGTRHRFVCRAILLSRQSLSSLLFCCWATRFSIRPAAIRHWPCSELSSSEFRFFISRAGEKRRTAADARRTENRCETVPEFLLLILITARYLMASSLSTQSRDIMIKTRLLLTVAAAIALVTGASVATAQGITTGGVTGTVTDPSGAPIEGAQIQVRNAKTGFTAG